MIHDILLLRNYEIFRGHCLPQTIVQRKRIMIPFSSNCRVKSGEAELLYTKKVFRILEILYYRSFSPFVSLIMFTDVSSVETQYKHDMLHPGG